MTCVSYLQSGVKAILIAIGGQNMSKVAMLIEKGYQEAEALVPYYRLLEAGYEVDVVGTESGIVYLSLIHI